MIQDLRNLEVRRCREGRCCAHAHSQTIESLEIVLREPNELFDFDTPYVEVTYKPGWGPPVMLALPRNTVTIVHRNKVQIHENPTLRQPE